MASTYFLVLIIFFFVVCFNNEVKANCGGVIEVIDSTNRIIESPGYPSEYPPNQHCTWEIKTTPDSRIGVHTSSFTLEGHSSCDYDSVTLKSKMDDGQVKEHGKFCGSNGFPTTVSESNILLIEFKSDGGRQYKGFRINFRSAYTKCGGLIFGRVGFIRSPLFPFSYPPNMNCTWTILAPQKQNVRLRFKDFKTEESIGCDRDYVTVQSKMANEELREHGKFCGQEIPHDIFSDSNILLLQFVSNGEVEFFGFQTEISYESCGGLIQGSKGNMSTPFYPNSYPPNKICEWTFLVPPQHKLKLRFLQFETEEGGDDCSNDFVLVQSRTADGEIHEYGKYCGSSPPPLIYSKDTILLTFVSDLRFQMKGFKAEYFIDMLSDYELSASSMKLTTASPNESTTVNQYENEEKENVTEINETNVLSEALKLLSEKVASTEESVKILFRNYDNLLKISNLLTSKNSFLKEGGKNSSSSLERQLSNDCAKYIFFLRRMLDSEP